MPECLAQGTQAKEGNKERPWYCGDRYYCIILQKINISKKLHVIFYGKVLRPEEPFDLKPNVHYVVTIEQEKKQETQNLWDVVEYLAGKVEGLEGWSQEHNHYLYHTPKRGRK